MNIIQKQPNPSGAYPPIQSWSGEVPPDTHYEITADTTEFFNGYIIPTFENGVMTSYVCNTELWEAWKAQTPKPTIESLKAQLFATDYKAIKYAEGWISEVDYAPIKAERQALRDQINALEGYHEPSK